MKISEDKQLWVHIVERYVHSCGSHLPVQIEARALGELEASTVQFWARTAFELNRTYTKHGRRKMSYIDGLTCVTWIKLVRGRWCLVASSDLTQSRLIVFDGLRGLQNYETEVFLEGPVMDGVLEDSVAGINIALSIGSR